MESCNDPPSPCVNLCTLDASREFCLGCLRSLAEIAGWSGFTPAEKRLVLARLSARRTRWPAQPP
ncbi:MAG: DUF1289 domain-containing protein [Gammaproteobacteria bacterium]